MDLEVSSTSSGETLEPGAPPEGLDATWAEAPQRWHLARWCVARAHGVCRAMAKILAASGFKTNKEWQKYAGKLHLHWQGRESGNARRKLSRAQIQENATSKAQGVLEALRERAESMDAKAERTLSALDLCDAPRAQELYQLGVRVLDPTISEKSFRRVLADLGLAKAPKRPWRGRRQEARAAWSQECSVVLGRWRMPAGASEPSAAAGSAGGNGESSSAVGVAPGACASEPSAVQAALESVGVAPAAGASEPSAVQPAQVSGEVPGPAPRLGELTYATGEWAQWRHHQGYKELLQLLAEWESLKLPTRREVPGSELRARLLAARELQLARPSSRTPVGAERAAELQRVAQAVLAEVGQPKRRYLRRLLGGALHVQVMHTSATELAGTISRRLLELMAQAEEQECDTRPYPRTSPKTVLLFWCLQEATRAHEAEVERRVLRPGNPMEECYEEGENLLQQTLRQAKCGILGKAQRRRLEQYRRHLDVSFMREHAEAVMEALSSASGLPVYVPGDEIRGDALREFADVPSLTAPLVCMLCNPNASDPDCCGASGGAGADAECSLASGGAGFLAEESFLRHCEAFHSGWAEYRKRVLFLLEARGPHPISAQEKRLMVQNYAFFEQHSLPSAGGNAFKDVEPVPRGEAACACCARLDWLERRYKLRLFAEAPEGSRTGAPEEDAEETDSSGGEQSQQKAQRLLRVRGEYYLQAPAKVAELLAVERYRQRWPLIPAEELHASSVQHPEQPAWRWLLHTRRVPVMADKAAQRSAAAGGSDGADEPVEETPRCAGVGDAEMASWVCWQCLVDLSGARPRMPLYALANDNWVGRERVEVKEASEATRWLSCLGRVCWKQLRLGHGAPDVQQRGIAGNTIFLAQPAVTLNSETLDLPPERDALVDCVNIAFTGSTGSLAKARWAQVKRAEYMRLVSRRRRECAAYAQANVDELAAATRLPENGVPPHLEHCVQHIEGVEDAPVQLTGPASRAPERGAVEEAGEESEQGSEEAAGEEQEGGEVAQPSLQEVNANVATASIAVDPSSFPKDTQMLQVLKAQISELERQANTVLRRERQARVENSDGVLEPVEDAGGRQRLREVVLDVQSVARSLDRRGRLAVEVACANAEEMLAVDPVTLAVPSQGKPLNAWDARTWPCCFTEWWFGDGAPNLARQRPMLFEEVAAMLLEREELQYSLESDEAPYTARAPSRFVAPEIVAVLGDVRRRLALLRGTRAATQRRGYKKDLQSICGATPEDYEAALGLAGPRDSILSALGHKDMPAAVKTALRTLLLSTSDVPGTEGRKVALRHDGHGNNLFFGAATYFCTPNFADNYSPLMWLLHNGPTATAHLMSAPEPRLDIVSPEMLRPAPRMPSLERMHQVSAANPRAQAKFFLLKTELHNKFFLGLQKQHIGRMTLSSFPSSKEPLQTYPIHKA